MNIKKFGLTALTAVFSTLVTLAGFSYYQSKVTPVSFEQKQQLAKFASWRSNEDSYSPKGMADFTYAASITTPGVVHITTTIKVMRQRQQQNIDPFFQFFGQSFPGFQFQQPQQQEEEPEEASGSGVIISPDGYIVTNNHVIEDGNKIEVKLYDKKTYTADVVGTDPQTDLALLKIDEKDLPFITFGNSDSVKVGQWVLAVGNPFNLESTVTAGIISAKGRNLDILKDHSAIEDYIQTDAAVNPGNSGGALVNPRGELVGINSAIATPTGSFAGYAFAVPVNIVKKVVDDLLKYGMVERGYLGIGIADPNDMTKEQLKKLDISQMNGVYVDSIFPNGAGAAAGLKQGDIITKINGEEIDSRPELLGTISNYHPGDKISITYLRDNKEETAYAVLKNKEGETTYEKKEVNAVYNLLGAQFQSLTDDEKKNIGIDGGVKVTKLSDGILSHQTDIKEGFIITKVDGKPINNTDDLKKALEGKKGGTMIEGMYPDRPGVYYYAFGIN
jgi:serine protease Do